MSKHKLRSYRNFLINPRFQLPLIATNFLVMLVIFAIAWFGTRNALVSLKPAAPLSSMEAEFFRNYVDYQTRNIQASLLLAFGIGAVVGPLITLVLSHRLAGPLVRLRIFFQTIADGKMSSRRIEFRDGDFLQELEPIINTAIEQIQEHPVQQAPLKKSA